MNTQKHQTNLALFDPRYFPRISEFRRLFYADSVIILDAIPVRGVWHNVQSPEDEAKYDPINIAMLPSEPLKVPFKNIGNQTFANVVCRQDGWQSNHVHILSENYKGHSHNLGPVLDQIANFPIRYSDGIRRMWRLLADYIDTEEIEKIIFLSDLKKLPTFTNRADLTITLGKKFGATHILYPQNGWIYHRAKISKHFTVLRDNFPLPRYISRYHPDWSIIDAIAKLGQLGLADYFTTIATKDGWRVI
ncbi:hypothetical protein LCGC14_1448220 [marine sediment metagenome]|uniref:Uncharacterized protein n=1 Tax=marine sediment metagenome TaxID=412755 RepID=A0A0F9LZ20_9ZZZZ